MIGELSLFVLPPKADTAWGPDTAMLEDAVRYSELQTLADLNAAKNRLGVTFSSITSSWGTHVTGEGNVQVLRLDITYTVEGGGIEELPQMFPVIGDVVGRIFEKHLQSRLDSLGRSLTYNPAPFE